MSGGLRADFFGSHGLIPLSGKLRADFFGSHGLIPLSGKLRADFFGSHGLFSPIGKLRPHLNARYGFPILETEAVSAQLNDFAYARSGQDGCCDGRIAEQITPYLTGAYVAAFLRTDFANASASYLQKVA